MHRQHCYRLQAPVVLWMWPWLSMTNEPINCFLNALDALYRSLRVQTTGCASPRRSRTARHFMVPRPFLWRRGMPKKHVTYCVPQCYAAGTAQRFFNSPVVTPTQPIRFPCSNMVQQVQLLGWTEFNDSRLPDSDAILAMSPCSFQMKPWKVPTLPWAQAWTSTGRRSRHWWPRYTTCSWANFQECRTVTKSSIKRPKDLGHGLYQKLHISELFLWTKKQNTPILETL